MYTLADLKNPDTIKGSVKYLLKDTGFDKEGRFQGPSQSIMPSQYTLITEIKNLSIYDKQEHGNGSDLVEVNCEYFSGVPKPTKDGYGRVVMEGTLGDVVFTNGALVVDKTKISLYKFMEYNPLNADNILKVTTNTQPIIYKFQPKKKLLEDDKKLRMETQAVNLAYNLIWDDAKLYAKALGIDISEGEEYTRAELAKKAKNDPERFLDGHKSADMQYRAVINSAIEAKIIEYSGSTGEWNRLERDLNKKVKRNHIIRVPQGSDGFDYFVNYLIQDDSGLFNLLEKLVREAGKGN